MSEANTSVSSVEIKEVMNYLPHRYPFLMVDRVLEYERGKSLVAVKNVSVNEPFFQGHFPGNPVMPGVMILEAFAQAAGILAFKSTDSQPTQGVSYYMAGIDNARFREPVTPGDQLMLHVTMNRTIRSIWKFSAEARVGDKTAASADLMVAVVFEDGRP
ncbi:MAG TPA: 3-hydroxyacyl-ACP dehydratase FabZ [Gammaproteobacteria bacterium]|nr:3-hydroxyacyl-ACP dehydratase FabZ [Gammaproteobacteria bacterium]